MAEDVKVRFSRPYKTPVFAKGPDGVDSFTGEFETGWREIVMEFHPLYAASQVQYYQRKGFRVIVDEPEAAPPVRGDFAAAVEPVEPVIHKRGRRKE